MRNDEAIILRETSLQSHALGVLVELLVWLTRPPARRKTKQSEQPTHTEPLFKHIALCLAVLVEIKARTERRTDKKYDS